MTQRSPKTARPPSTPLALIFHIVSSSALQVVLCSFETVVCIRWYRLALSCTFLSSCEPSGSLLSLSVDWASQIILHLSMDSKPTLVPLGPFTWTSTLHRPDMEIVETLATTIEQHWVVL